MGNITVTTSIQKGVISKSHNVTESIDIVVNICNNCDKDYMLATRCITTERMLFLKTESFKEVVMLNVPSFSNHKITIQGNLVLRKYGPKKKFTVKISGNLGVFESEKLSLNEIYKLPHERSWFFRRY